MKKVLKVLLILIIIAVVVFGIFLLISTITDYNPEEKTQVFKSENQEIVGTGIELTFISWNIGYAGLGAEQDFFYDGGSQVYPGKNVSLKNFKAIKQFLEQNSNTDFFLLQEVDKNSKRSAYINQYKEISDMFTERNIAFGKNYDVFFIPRPVTKPLGKVVSGIMTVSKNIPSAVFRVSYPGNFSWPSSLFFPHRCFLVNRYQLADEKELIVINTHNSAFDDGTLRDIQMEYLKNFILEEYKNGNYIIAGGDWNQSPHDFTPEFKTDKPDKINIKKIPENYLTDWKWAFDKTVPSNRRVDMPYKKGKSLTAILDFFIISPNLSIVNVKTFDLGFANSDHNPVKLTVKLK